MKHVIVSIAMFVLAFSSGNLQAQDVAMNYLPISFSDVSGDDLKSAYVAKVNIKAVRDFIRTYKDVTDAKWFITGDGFAAGFSSEGRNTKVVYDKKGRRQYQMTSYTESHLDAGIIKLVKSSYYDNIIIGVHQFEFDAKTVYLIKMLDQQSAPLSLILCDGRIKNIADPEK